MGIYSSISTRALGFVDCGVDFGQRILIVDF
jgi:hypothetical protein